jgi:hypothetical protein
MNDNEHYLVVDVPSNCEELKELINEKCGDK